MNKIVLFLTICMFIATSFLFAGCSLTRSWSGLKPTQDSGRKITDGINPSSGETGSIGDLPPIEGEQSKLATADAYKFMQGLKVAYDATENYKQFLQTANATSIVENLRTKLSKHSDYTIQDFVQDFPLYNLTQNKASQAFWVANVIEQYELFAENILTDLFTNFAFGRDNNFSLQSYFYGNLAFNGAESLFGDIMNVNPLTYYTEFSLKNPNYGKSSGTYKYTDVEYFTLNLTNKTFVVDDAENPLTVSDVPDKAINEFTSWKLNVFGIDGATQLMDQTFVFTNPLYDENSEEDDVCHYDKLTLKSILNETTKSYTYGFQCGDAKTKPTVTRNEVLQDFVNKYKFYFAYKIFEIACNPDKNVECQLDFNEVSLAGFLGMLDNYLDRGGYIGFPERKWLDSSENEYFVDKIVQLFCLCTMDKDTPTGEKTYGEYLTNLVNSTLDLKIDDNTVFSSVVNVEFIDFSVKFLVEQDNNNLIFPNQGKIVSIMFMFQPSTAEIMSGKTYTYQCSSLNFFSFQKEFDINTYAHYVQSGNSEFLEQLEYETLIEDPSQEVGGGYFKGTIQKCESQDITTEYLDANTIMVEDTPLETLATPSQKLTFNGFENNCESTFQQAGTIKNGSARYSFDETNKVVYYNETSTQCDYLEFCFNSEKSGEKSIAYLENWTFLFGDLVCDDGSNQE